MGRRIRIYYQEDQTGVSGGSDQEDWARRIRHGGSRRIGQKEQARGLALNN